MSSCDTRSFNFSRAKIYCIPCICNSPQALPYRTRLPSSPKPRQPLPRSLSQVLPRRRHLRRVPNHPGFLPDEIAVPPMPIRRLRRPRRSALKLVPPISLICWRLHRRSNAQRRQKGGVPSVIIVSTTEAKMFVCRVGVEGREHSSSLRGRSQVKNIT